MSSLDEVPDNPMLDHSMVHELNLETEHAIVLTKMLRK
jgi:hypothetical protein